MKTMAFGGYTLDKLLYASSNSLIYTTKATEKTPKAILKILNNESASEQEIIRFHQEFACTKKIKSPYVARIFDLVKDKDAMGLLVEDIEGVSLSISLKQERLSLVDGLNIAIKLCKGIRDIHKAGMIHKNISSSNVIWNQKANTVNIIDFGICSRLTLEAVSPVVFSQLEGDLFYMSPEQTGRMNRPTDYRTDFYSLGITLYEIFTGQLPFLDNDPLKLIHAHIAKTPTPPEKIRADIPPVLSKMIMKLLQKSPEKRYQTTYGIEQDLSERVFGKGNIPRCGQFHVKIKVIIWRLI